MADGNERYIATLNADVTDSKDDFFNPVKTPTKSLLSFKERVKGKWIPLLGKTALIALAAGITYMTGGTAPLLHLLPIMSILSPIYLIKERQFYNDRQNPAFCQVYDFLNPSHVAAFGMTYSQQHPDFVENYTRLAQKAGLKRPPLFIVNEKETSRATAQTSLLAKSPAQAISVSLDILGDATSAELLGVVAHEVGHIGLGHLGASRVVNQLAKGALLMLSFAGFLPAVYEVYGAVAALMSGVGFSAAAVMADSILDNKTAQYQERQADRFAMVSTGMAHDLSRFFIKRNKTYEDVSDKFNGEYETWLPMRVLRDVFRLVTKHPSDARRIVYAERFENENKEYCSSMRQAFGSVAARSANDDYKAEISHDKHGRMMLRLEMPLAADKKSLTP